MSLRYMVVAGRKLAKKLFSKAEFFLYILPVSIAYLYPLPAGMSGFHTLTMDINQVLFQPVFYYFSYLYEIFVLSL